MALPLNYDLFRLVILRNATTEILLEQHAEGLSLPTVHIPRHSRISQEITSAVKHLWNLDTCCLFSLRSNDPPEPPIYDQILEICANDARSPDGTDWVPLGSLSTEAFRQDSDLAAVESCLRALGQYDRGELRGLFGKPGWFPAVRNWVEIQATTIGLRLTGEFWQYNASPNFGLIRFATSGPALWFKAVGEPNVREFSISLKLAQLFPAFVPRILGSHAEWNAWLSVEVVGNQLGEGNDDSDWARTARALGDLQTESIGRGLHLIEIGCKDLRTRSLCDLLDPFLETMTELMSLQRKPRPAPLSREELLSLGATLRSSLEELDECAIPNTLGHLDFNPGNILVSRDQCAFLDWAEAYVGPPFFTFQYLLEHARQVRGANTEWQARLLSSYMSVWPSFASLQKTCKAMRVAPLLAALAFAAGSSVWRDPVRRGRPETAAHLRSMTRWLKREADRLNDARSMCRI